MYCHREQSVAGTKRRFREIASSVSVRASERSAGREPEQQNRDHATRRISVKTAVAVAHWMRSRNGETP